jgi:AcrR family transcriptional regulator
MGEKMSTKRQNGIDSLRGSPQSRYRTPAFNTGSNAAKEDPRIRRTRRAIVEAYVILAGEKGPGSFGVIDITQKAGLNRATFYRHFEDEADLRSRGIPLVLAEIAEGFPNKDSVADSNWEKAARERVRRLFELLVSHPGFFGPLLSQQAGTAGQVTAFLEGFLLDKRLLPSSQRLALPPALGARALCFLLEGFASWALEHPGSLSPTELADRYLAIVSNGLLLREGSSGTAKR